MEVETKASKSTEERSLERSWLKSTYTWSNVTEDKDYFETDVKELVENLQNLRVLSLLL